MKVSLKTDGSILFECDTLSCGDVVEHDGKTYSVCREYLNRNVLDAETTTNF